MGENSLINFERAGLINLERVIQTIIAGAILYFILGLSDDLKAVTRKVDVLSERVAHATADRYRREQAQKDFALRDERHGRLKERVLALESPYQVIHEQ